MTLIHALFLADTYEDAEHIEGCGYVCGCYSHRPTITPVFSGSDLPVSIRISWASGTAAQIRECLGRCLPPHAHPIVVE